MLKIAVPNKGSLSQAASEMLRESGYRQRNDSKELALTDAEMLAAENLTGFRWWTAAELAAHDGPEVFGPRDLPGLFADLLRDGPPAAPRPLGR